MDLHLSIDGDLAGTIEIDLHAISAHTVAYLNCRRLDYEEIGGEGFNANCHRSRQTLTQETLDALQSLLPSRPVAPPPNAVCGLDETTFTLTIGRGANAVEYSWGSRPPTEWECLRDIVHLLVTSAGIAAYVDLYPDPRPADSHTA